MSNEATQPSESEKFRSAMKQIVSVPKTEIDRRERAYKEERKRIKSARKAKA